MCAGEDGTGFTKVKLVMMCVLSATNNGGDLAAYFLPAKATIYPPDITCRDVHQNNKVNDRFEKHTWR